MAGKKKCVTKVRENDTDKGKKGSTWQGCYKVKKGGKKKKEEKKKDKPKEKPKDPKKRKPKTVAKKEPIYDNPIHENIYDNPIDPKPSKGKRLPTRIQPPRKAKEKAKAPKKRKMRVIMKI